MPVPLPTPILRFLHIDNLPVYLTREACHAPNFTPDDGLGYRKIHNAEIQARRNVRPVPCGSGGVIHDYLAFYFGPLSPMMFQLKTGRVAGYTEGQEPLVYLVSTAQAVEASGIPFVFSDGHGIARFTSWFDDLVFLDRVDWEMVNQRYWADEPTGDNDRQRRKQAEFLVYERLDWSLVEEIVVINAAMAARVSAALAEFPDLPHPEVVLRPDWYY